MTTALAHPLRVATDPRVAKRVKRAEVGRWELQQPGPYAPWRKIDTYLEGNRKAGRMPSTVTHLHLPDYLDVSKQTPRNWKRDSRLPPVLFCRWLAEQMGLTIEEFLDPHHPYGEPAPHEERAEEALRRALGDDWPAFAAAIERNPALGRLVVALGSAARRHPPPPHR